LTRYAADLVIPDEARAECAVLKGTAAYFVMFTDERRSVMGGQRAQVHELVDAFQDQPEARLDPLHLLDFQGAPDDEGALRAVIDQVASLSDPRALILHRRWC
jgi:dGTPase